MRVLVNLAWLVPGVVGGSEEAMVRLLRALHRRHADEVDLHLLVLEPFPTAHPDLVEMATTTTVLPLRGRVKPARVVAETVALTALGRRSPAADVVHQAGGTAPGAPGRATVLTIHDVQPLDHPDRFGAVKVAHLRRAIPRSVARADITIVPSGFVRDGLLERFTLDPERVVVVPHAVPPPAPGAPLADLRRRYDLPERFLVFNAITYPHKDHATAVRALARLTDDHADVGLVLTGGRGPSEDDVLAAVDEAGVTARVRRTGRIPAADVAGLLDHAVALVFPSRYEGFGLPVVEAMSRGTPVVAARAASVPEIAGDAAVLVEPGDDEAMAAAVRAVLDEPVTRDAMAAAGRRRAEAFLPAVGAGLTVAAYRQALDRR